MIKEIKGTISASKGTYAIVVSRFNEFITSKLLGGAVDCLQRHGASDEQITVVWVPGSIEITTAAKKLATSGKYDAVICLGAVIRGATPHFDYVSAEVSKGVAQASMDSEITVIFGVITTDTIEQAIERAGAKAGNKGWEAAMAASHYKLTNVVTFVDRNRLMIDGTTETVMGIEPLSDKWKAFGWHVQEISGHDIPAPTAGLQGNTARAEGPSGRHEGILPSWGRSMLVAP